jgi:hypothetical protein
VNLTEAAHHVAYKLPNERRRVTQFLDSMASQDPELLAAIAAVKQDDPGMCNSFEQTVTFISPSDPVARKKQSNKRPAAEISATFVDGQLRQRGSTGVEFRWYKRKEFVALNEAQKEELKGWAATQPDKRTVKLPSKGKKTPGALVPGSDKFNKAVKAQIVAIKSKETSQPVKKEQTADALIATIKAPLTSVAKAEVGSTKAVSIVEPVAAAADSSEIHLWKILKKSKFT